MSTSIRHTTRATGLAVALFASVASANTGTIRFEGRLTNATCEVLGGTEAFGPNFTVVLPTVSTAQMNVGEFAGRTRFPMKLQNCTDVVGTVRAHFDAGATIDANFRTLRPNNGGPVHFALFDEDGTRLAIGEHPQAGGTPATPLGTGYAANDTMYYEVAYHRVGAAAPVAGDFFSTVTYSLKYD
ncbi:type 1 fimbrial protein [Lysobacter sp. KIS68-7]|uniref:fimbrial protein n=1 Tax=Lysobacter sp. KIS68-7 TaxID=2904252 RepID=UPI001E385E99|nr:fimbrial protein [Lysobacter sp. KIS68-7]UHQ19464.1 type 1 fimbrial protein [Lysobacter sp. KIS68-7]